MALLHIEWLEVESGSPQVSIVVAPAHDRSVNSRRLLDDDAHRLFEACALAGGPALDGSAQDFIDDELTDDDLVGAIAEGDAEQADDPRRRSQHLEVDVDRSFGLTRRQQLLTVGGSFRQQRPPLA